MFAGDARGQKRAGQLLDKRAYCPWVLGATFPISTNQPSEIHWGKCKMSHKGKAYGALGNTLDAGKGECSVGGWQK
jgi:hypothetical protein